MYPLGVSRLLDLWSLVTLWSWIYLPRCGTLLLLEFRSLGQTPSGYASAWLTLPQIAVLILVTVLLRDPFALPGESEGGGWRCSHGPEEANVADRRDLQEGIQKARLWILPKVIEVRKAKESNWQRNFQSSDEKKEGKGEKPGTREFHRNQRWLTIQREKQNKTTLAYLTDQEDIL